MGVARDRSFERRLTGQGVRNASPSQDGCPGDLGLYGAPAPSVDLLKYKDPDDPQGLFGFFVLPPALEGLPEIAIKREGDRIAVGRHHGK